MTELWLILVSTVLVNNIVLAHFLGLCPMMGVTRSLPAGLAMACATAFVLTLSSGLTWLLDHYLLMPFDLGYLRIVVFLLVIALLVVLSDATLRETHPMMHGILGLYLPLIASNCAILGVALLNVLDARTFVQSLAFGFGAALGFTLVLVLFAGARDRLAGADVPEAFRGPGIALVTAGMLSLAFMGFSGFGIR